MTLTQSQIEGIKSLYGEDVAGAEKAIETIKSKRGALRIFNEDGTVNISKEVLEKKLNKKPKLSIPKVSSDELNANILELLNQTKGEIRKLKNLGNYETIKSEIKKLYHVLENRKKELLDSEIESIDKEIEALQQRKEKFLAEKNGENK